MYARIVSVNSSVMVVAVVVEVAAMEAAVVAVENIDLRC